MTDERMALIELVQKQADGDLVPERLLEPIAQRSFDPVDRMKAEEGPRQWPLPPGASWRPKSRRSNSRSSGSRPSANSAKSTQLSAPRADAKSAIVRMSGNSRRRASPRRVCGMSREIAICELTQPSRKGRPLRTPDHSPTRPLFLKRGSPCPPSPPRPSRSPRRPRRASRPATWRGCGPPRRRAMCAQPGICGERWGARSDFAGVSPIRKSSPIGVTGGRARPLYRARFLMREAWDAESERGDDTLDAEVLAHWLTPAARLCQRAATSAASASSSGSATPSSRRCASVFSR